MGQAGEERVRVAFPANANYAPVGRVAVAGLALRLGVDVGQVENLRLAVSTSIAALAGGGTVTLIATWTDDELRLDLENPLAEPRTDDTRDLVAELSQLVTEASVGATHISLSVNR